MSKASLSEDFLNWSYLSNHKMQTWPDYCFSGNLLTGFQKVFLQNNQDRYWNIGLEGRKRPVWLCLCLTHLFVCKWSERHHIAPLISFLLPNTVASIIFGFDTFYSYHFIVECLSIRTVLELFFVKTFQILICDCMLLMK